MKICPKCSTQYDGEQSICSLDGEVLRDDHAEMIGRVLDNQYEIKPGDPELKVEGALGTKF